MPLEYEYEYIPNTTVFANTTQHSTQYTNILVRKYFAQRQFGICLSEQSSSDSWQKHASQNWKQAWNCFWLCISIRNSKATPCSYPVVNFCLHSRTRIAHHNVAGHFGFYKCLHQHHHHHHLIQCRISPMSLSSLQFWSFW